MTCWNNNGMVHNSTGWVSGLGGPCQNNPIPACTSQVNAGPIPPGFYTSSGRPAHRPPNTTRRNLTPDPRNQMWGRGGFQTHFCPNIQNCSNGRLSQPNMQTMQQFNNFLGANPGARIQATGFTEPSPGYFHYLSMRFRQFTGF